MAVEQLVVVAVSWFSVKPGCGLPYLDSQSTLCASTWLVQQLLRPWLYNRSVDYDRQSGMCHCAFTISSHQHALQYNILL
jgi:hypothetical protein